MRDTRYAADIGEAFELGFRETKESLGRVVGFLATIIRGEGSAANAGGPLTIAQVATMEASVGLGRLLLFLTLLSSNLAIVNFLPIPVLDGGHFLFLLAEAVIGRPVDERLQQNLTLLGFLFVVSLMLFVLFLDVVRFSGLGG